MICQTCANRHYIYLKPDCDICPECRARSEAEYMAAKEKAEK